MSPLTRTKLSLALAGLLVFGIGVKTGNATLRWVAIGLVAASWLLRFARGRGSE